jgi:cytochrome c-type biogenesis protein CcmH/NrfG
MQYKRSEVRKPLVGGSFPFFIARFVVAASVVALWAAGSMGQASSGSAAVSGTVLFGSDNRPASHVAVSLRSSSQQIFRSILTDSEGHFEVGGLPNGVYEISAEESGCASERVSTNVQGVVAGVAVHLRPYRTAPIGNGFAVSVRELEVSEKARAEFQKGLARMAKSDYSEALKHLVKATQIFPQYYEAFHYIGVAQMKMDHLEQAVEAFQRSIDLSVGAYAEPMFGLGYASYLQGKWKEAEAILRRGLERDSNSAEGYFYLGTALFALNLVAEAEKSARGALLRKPNYAAPYIVLANVFGRRHEFHEQLQAMDSYLKLEPNGPSADRVRAARETTLRLLANLDPAGNLTAQAASPNR